jgi:hypothetical protein
MSLTKLEYRVWGEADDRDALQTKSEMTMTDYRFRVNAELAGINPRHVATQIHWGESDCRFSITAEATADAPIQRLGSGSRRFWSSDRTS